VKKRLFHQNTPSRVEVGCLQESRVPPGRGTGAFPLLPFGLSLSSGGPQQETTVWVPGGNRGGEAWTLSGERGSVPLGIVRH